MEVAAKKVQVLSQSTLPEQPHQLAINVDKRYPVGSDLKRGLEEKVFRGLQYMTYLSDGDRGVLLTRSYHDMREEPTATNATPSGTPVRSDKRPSTKISLSDYKNKVKKQSQSPPQPVMASRAAEEPRSLGHEARNSQGQKGKDISQAPKEGRPHGLRDTLLHDRPSSLPPKPPMPVRDAHGSPGRRKRAADEEDSQRPQKRAKPDVNGTSHDRPRTPKQEPIRNGVSDAVYRRDVSGARAKSPRPAESKGSGAAEANGRSILKAAMSSARPVSPDSRPRATSLNGTRPSSSGSTKPAATKTTAALNGRPAVPPLLSPLHLSFHESEAAAKGEKRKKEEPYGDHQASVESLGQTAVPKKNDDPLPQPLPPLLSPTLPSFLETELTRLKKTPSKSSESKSSADLSPRSPTHGRKTRPSREDDDQPQAATGPRRIVRLKLSKRATKHVQRLLALPVRKERSTSIDSQPSQPSRKRPLPTSGGTITVDASDPVAVKRPRRSEASVGASRTAAPSTPQRSSICVSHHVDTPGEGGLDGPPSSQPKVLLANVPPNVEALKKRYERYKGLGTKLKHARDDVIKNFPPTDGIRQLPETELKLSTVTGIEAILSYMAGFNALSEARHLERKVKDHTLWKSLLPLVNELQLLVREHVFPKAVLSILQEIVLQEIVTTLVVSGDFRNQNLVQEIRRVGREHEKVKRVIPGLFRQVEEANEEAAFPLELPVIYSGEPVEQAVSKTLLAIKSWAVRERVEWEAKLSTEEILSGA